MDFSELTLSDEDRAFAQDVAQALDEKWTPVRHVISNDHDRLPPELRSVMAEKGWLSGAHAREGAPGSLSPVQVELLQQLRDARGLPGNGGSGMFIGVLQKYGSERLRSEILPNIVAGRTTVCIGYTEPDCGSDLGASRTKAVRDGGDWVINGQKMFTTWAHESDYIFLLTRTDAAASKNQALTVFLVPMDAPGVEITPIWTLDDARTNLTFYTDVRVPDEYRVGPVGSGWEVVTQPLAIEHGAVGAQSVSRIGPINGDMGAGFSRTLEQLIDFAIEWAKERLRLDDPHVRRAIAEALVDLEVCWNTPSEAGKPVAAAALIKHADRFSDMAAPESVLAVSDGGSVAAGVIANARMHSPGADIYGGTSEIYWNNIARQIGLPRPY